MPLIINDMLYISKRIYMGKIDILFWDKQYALIKHFSRFIFDTTM